MTSHHNPQMLFFGSSQSSSFTKINPASSGPLQVISDSFFRKNRKESKQIRFCRKKNPEIPRNPPFLPLQSPLNLASYFRRTGAGGAGGAFRVHGSHGSGAVMESDKQ